DFLFFQLRNRLRWLYLVKREPLVNPDTTGPFASATVFAGQERRGQGISPWTRAFTLRSVAMRLLIFPTDAGLCSAHQQTFFLAFPRNPFTLKASIDFQSRTRTGPARCPVRPAISCNVASFVSRRVTRRHGRSCSSIARTACVR